MVLNFWALHRHPSLWPRADEFLPERWLPEYAPTLGPSRSDALMPFNVGPHACIGATLANAEVRGRERWGEMAQVLLLTPS